MQQTDLPQLCGGLDNTDLAAAGMPQQACAPVWAAAHAALLRPRFAALAAAGCDALLAPTAGALEPLLAPHGYASQVQALNEQLLRDTRAAAAGLPVGAALGPSGLDVPPGGHADFDDLYDFYRAQVRALEDAGADFLFLEGQQSLADLRAAALAARVNDLPVLATLDVDTDGESSAGCALLPALLTLQAMDLQAFGLRFSCAPEAAAALVADLLPHAAIPLAVQPSRATTQGLPPADWAARMAPALRAGGGPLLCYLPPAHVAALSQLHVQRQPLPQQPDCEAAAIAEEAFFLAEDLELSAPVPCTLGLADAFIAIDDEFPPVTLVMVDSVEDARLLAAAGPFTRQPIAVHAETKPLLDAALRYFQGRLLIDTACPLEDEVLEPLAAKYGAILY